MSEIRTSKWLVFKENTYKLLKLQSIGCADFGSKPLGGFWTTNMWHALYYVTSGSGSYTVRGNTYPLHKGDFFFVLPNEPIFYTSQEDTIRYCWFGLYPEFAGEIADIMGLNERPVKKAKAPQRVERILDCLLEARSANVEVYFNALASLMQIMSTECAVRSIEHSDKTEVHREAFVENVRQLIELNYTNPQFRIETAAGMLYVSHAHMTREFRELTGITPVAYLTELRLNHAADMLAEGEYTVKQLVEASGFRDEWHFMKSFKKKYGMTVGEYREHMRCAP